MNWLNIHTDYLRSPEFLGSEPTDRATWLCLLAWCVSQENGGTIIGARQWKDRKWQQLCGVTQEETHRTSDLWEWDGDDLVVGFYPDEKQKEVEHLREVGKSSSPAKKAAARANGAKGGRPRKTQQKPNTKTHGKTQQEPIEEKGREEKGIEGKGKEHAPTRQEVLEHARTIGLTGIGKSWLRSWCVQFWAAWEERQWQTQTGRDLRAAGAWKHRLLADLEKDIREGRHKTGGNTVDRSGNPPTKPKPPRKVQDPVEAAKVKEVFRQVQNATTASE